MSLLALVPGALVVTFIFVYMVNAYQAMHTELDEIDDTANAADHILKMSFTLVLCLLLSASVLALWYAVWDALST